MELSEDMAGKIRKALAKAAPYVSTPDFVEATQFLDRLTPTEPEVDEATVWTRKIWGTEDDGAYDHDTVFQETRAVIAELLASKDAEIEQWKSQERVAFEHQQKAESELAAVSAAIGTTEFMDPPDGGSPTLAEQVGRMRAELAALRAENERLKADNLKHLEELFDRISAMDEIAKGVHGQGPNWFDECQRRIDLARNWRNLSKTAERNQAVAVGHLYDKSGRRTNAPFMAVVLPSGGVTKAAERNTAEPELCDDEGCPHHGTPHVCIDTSRSGGMPPGTNAGAVEVTQADRDATAKVLDYQCWADATDYRLTGAQDRQVEKFVSAFARHRTEAEARGRREALDEAKEYVRPYLENLDSRHEAILRGIVVEFWDGLESLMTGGK